jgi:hypothetical protein
VLESLSHSLQQKRHYYHVYRGYIFCCVTTRVHDVSNNNISLFLEKHESPPISTTVLKTYLEVMEVGFRGTYAGKPLMSLALDK